ncbi:MAG: hypothetical protein QXG26_01990 [Candidatus Aenigmatarchaeota archaeon]
MINIKKGLKEYAERGKIAIASGDNYGPAISALHAIGIELYGCYIENDKEIFKKLTGNETKNRNYSSSTKHGTESNIQPPRAYFEPNDEGPFIPIIPPQDFPNYMKYKKLEIVVGAGYDIQINECGIENPPLNGKFKDPNEWDEVMEKGLLKAKQKGVNLNQKPVMFPLLAYRKIGADELKDLKYKKKIEALSEFPHIFEEFCKEKGIPLSNMVKVYGRAEYQLGSGFAHIGTDIVETGNSILADIERIRIIYDNGEPVVIMYSMPWLLTTLKEYNANRAFFNALFNEMKNALKNIDVKNEIEKFDNFFKKFKEKEKELGLE